MVLVSILGACCTTFVQLKNRSCFSFRNSDSLFDNWNPLQNRANLQLLKEHITTDAFCELCSSGNETIDHLQSFRRPVSAAAANNHDSRAGMYLVGDFKTAPSLGNNIRPKLDVWVSEIHSSGHNFARAQTKQALQSWTRAPGSCAFTTVAFSPFVLLEHMAWMHDLPIRLSEEPSQARRLLVAYKDDAVVSCGAMEL